MTPFLRFVNLKIYGKSLVESYKLDVLLSSFDDGLSRLEKIVLDVPDGIPIHDIQRVLNKLISDNYLEREGANLKINSRGILHLDKGGYVGELKQSKRLVLSFWFSLIAVSISIASFLISLFVK